MTPFEIGTPPRPFCDASRLVQRRMPGPRRAALRSTRAVPEETAIAFSYEGAAYAVMMATPADLTDFAIDFSLTERIIRSPCDLETLETVSAAGGAVLLTSRVSVEMIQKAAIFGVPILVAVSAPTALAVRVAEAAGITLAAVARHDGFEIFTHADRLLDVEFEQPAAAD